MNRISHLLSILGCVGLLAAIVLLTGGGYALGALSGQDADETATTQDSESDADDSSDDEVDAESTVTPPEKPQRVVIQTGRHESHHGTVEREDDTIIVIDSGGEIKSFVRSRILHLTRLVDPQPDQRGIVFLRDGSRKEGVIVIDDYDKVVIEMNGIHTQFERPAVHHVELIPTVLEQYEAFKANTPRDQYARRFDLCRWLVEKGEFHLALKEIESLEKDNPNQQALPALAREVRAQVALLDDKSVAPDAIGGDRPSTSQSGESTGPVNHADTLPTKIISERDANLIRVYEIDFRNPPKVQVKPDTIRALIQNYASHKAIPANAAERTALFRADSIDIARTMFEVRARDLYAGIEVLTEPYALNLFKQRVHNTWLINNCATSRCHGGVRAGRLFLHNRKYRDDRVRMTNLLILERLKLDSDKPPLIDYNEPLNSLIIQYGLPITESRYPHPDVSGWKPVFSPANKRLLEDAIKWVRTMYSPRPEYPVEFDPPRLAGGMDAEVSDSDGKRRDR